MKKKIFYLATASIMAFGALANVGSAFATNEYGIDYAGGEPLSESNVTVDSSLRDLTPLFKSGSVSFSNSDKWESAYIKGTNVCREYHFVRAWDNNRVSPSDNLYYIISNEQYDVKVQINKIVLDSLPDASEDGAKYTFGTTVGNVGAGHGPTIYADAECTVKYDENMKAIKSTDEGKIFVETNIKIYKHGTNELFTSDKLYFGITDIDASQSYKILNSGALLTGESMLARNTVPFDGGDGGERNMFVASGNYIYSQSHFETEAGSDIFLKVPVNEQEQGLNVVFGYSAPAGSSVQYYAKQHNIQYQSDEGGVIDGITAEDVISGNNASGSSVNTSDGFELLHWIADTDITLDDGTAIQAGEPITTAQLEHIIVSEDIIVTAIHEDHRHTVNYESDDNGDITGIDSEPVAPGNNPTGTETAPKDDYEFDHWEADVDVILEDGTEIPAGDPITPEQVPQIIVTEDITLTAVHKSNVPAVPNTGVITNTGISAIQITISTIAIILVATLVKIAPKLLKKRVGFKG